MIVDKLSFTQSTERRAPPSNRHGRRHARDLPIITACLAMLVLSMLLVAFERLVDDLLIAMILGALACVIAAPLFVPTERRP